MAEALSVLQDGILDSMVLIPTVIPSSLPLPYKSSLVCSLPFGTLPLCLSDTTPSPRLSVCLPVFPQVWHHCCLSEWLDDEM